MVIKAIIRNHFTQKQAYYKKALFDAALTRNCIERLPLMIRDFLKEVPVPTAGLALGVVAIGKLISPYNSYFEITCTTISIVLIALVTAKALLCRKALAHDLHQPVQAAVFGTFFYDLHATFHLSCAYLFTFGSCFVVRCSYWSIRLNGMVYPRALSGI